VPGVSVGAEVIVGKGVKVSVARSVADGTDRTAMGSVGV
jgi:hypothetical protein